MEKRIMRIISWALGLCLSIAGIGAAISASRGAAVETRAETTTYQHVFNARPSIGDNVNLSGVAWNISATNLGTYNSNNYAGVQIGSSKANGSISLTSASAWNYDGKKKISEVRLWLNRGGTSVTPTVSIGGKEATSDGTAVVKNTSAGNDYTKATKVTFTPAMSGYKGVLVITVDTVNAGYICAMEVDCKDLASDLPGNVKPLTIFVKLDDIVLNDDQYDFTGVTFSTVQFSVEVTYDDSEGYVAGSDYFWTSSDTSIATIDDDGLATIITKGETIITVTTEDATVSEDNISASFILNTDGASHATGTDVSVPYGVNDAIAAFDNIKDTYVYIEGYITRWSGKYDGHAFIADSKTPSSEDGEIQIYGGVNILEGDRDQWVIGSKVIVYGLFVLYQKNVSTSIYETTDNVAYITEVESPTGISVSYIDKTTYNVGDTFDPSGLTLIVEYPSREGRVEYRWYVEDFSFVPSLETELTAEDDKVTVTYFGVSVDIPITIDTLIHTESITLQEGGANVPGQAITRALDFGDITLNASLVPYNSDDPVSWTTSDSTIATVDDGVVTAKDKTGTVRITATSGGQSDYVDITYTEPSDAAVTSIEIVEGSGVVKDYYKDTDLDQTGLSVTATFTSANVPGWTKSVENYTDQISYSFDRENGKVIARYNNSDSIKDSIDVNVHKTYKPLAYELDLSVASYSSASTTQVVWNTIYATMTVDKAGANTNADNYLPKAQTSSRFYKNSILTISPAFEDGYFIDSLVFDATTTNYATALANSAFTNATAVASSDIVTVTPTDGTQDIVVTIGGACGFSSVTINYTKTWARTFLEKFTCSGVTNEHPNGDITAENPSDLWQDLADIYEALGENLVNVTGNVSGSLDEQAIARYDLILAKYGTDTDHGGYEDFIGRIAAGKLSLQNDNSFVASPDASETHMPLIIAIIATGAVTAAGYFFLRKMKEN